MRLLEKIIGIMRTYLVFCYLQFRVDFNLRGKLPVRAMVWFRRDLRLEDNPALFHACEKADEGVMAVYIADPAMWARNDTSAIQIAFILAGVRVLQQALAAIGIPLYFAEVEQTEAIPDLLISLAKKHAINCLFLNQEYEVNESRRDRAVCEQLRQQHIQCEVFADQLILDESLVRSQKGEFFKVFTPFRKKWREVFLKEKVSVLAVPNPRQRLAIEVPDLSGQNHQGGSFYTGQSARSD